MIKIILDLYYGNVITSFENLKATVGKDFIIFKATQSTWRVDPAYRTRSTWANENNIPHWAYCFMETNDPIEQMDYFLNVINNPVGLILDVEDYQGVRPTRAQVKKAAKYLVEKGYKVMIYLMNAEIADYAGIASEVSPSMCAQWIARYGANTGFFSKAPDIDCDLHQYTSTGKVNGVSGNVDLSMVTGHGKTLNWFKIKNSEEDELNTEQDNKLTTIYNMLTRTDNAGWSTGRDVTDGKHNFYGRLNSIAKALYRTDNAGHNTPNNHDLYGRINLIEEQVAENAKTLAAIQKTLNKLVK